jgi:hypothetical protein
MNIAGQGGPTWPSSKVERPGAHHLAELALPQRLLQDQVAARELVLLVNLDQGGQNQIRATAEGGGGYVLYTIDERSTKTAYQLRNCTLS